MTEMENVDDVFALSPQQEGFLYHSIAAEDPGVFVTQAVIDLTGPVDGARMRAAWQAVLSRHPMLRTIFVWDGVDQPVQVVRSIADMPFAQIDWSGDDQGSQADRLDTFLREDRGRGFDLSQVPLMRVTLIRQPEGAGQMIWSFHHILLDGWSSQIVLRDVFRAYAGQGLPEASGLVYRDFIETIPEADSDVVADFWRPRLADIAAPTRFADRLGAKVPGHGMQVRRLPVSPSDALRDFARRSRVTLNTVFLGAWARLLATHSDEAAVVFGATLSGRGGDVPGLDTCIGLLMNTLPLRVEITEGDTARWLQDLQREQTRIQEMAQSPLVDVQRMSSVPPGVALFDSLVVFENLPDLDGAAFAVELEGTELSIDAIDYRDQSNYPMALVILPQQEIELRLVHDRSLFSDGFCDALLDQLIHVLGGFMDGSAATPAKLPICNAQAVPKSAPDAIPDTPPLSQLVTRHAAQDPDRPAARMAGRSLSYGALEATTNRIARTLAAAGIAPGDFVGVYARRGPDFLAGVLGILKSGAAFVPLDPDYPRQHHEFVCGDVPMRAILVADDLTDQALDLGPQVIRLNADTLDADDTAFDLAAPDNPAYLIHTSGSQGQRKGVVVTHRNLSYSTLARRAFYDHPPQRFLLLSPVSFDSAMVGLFWTLAEGGTLVLPEPGGERDVDYIARLIAGERVTHTLCIPSLYGLLLDAADPDQLSGLDTVALAGEACPPAVVRQHFDALPGTGLVNEYGPTEATVWSVAAPLSPALVADGLVPIGQAIPGAAAYILDRWCHPVPDGIEGELFIGGPGVAQGYFGKPDLTADRFLPDPFAADADARMYRTGDVVWRRADGQIVYTGRNDDQVKIRGFRVEPNEIAARLADHPDVAEAIVMLRPRRAAPDDAQILELLRDMDPAQAQTLIADIAALSDADVARQLTDPT